MSSAGPAASLKPPRGQKPLDLGKLPAVPGLTLVQGPSQRTSAPTGSSCGVCRRAAVVPPGPQSLFPRSRKPAAKRRLPLLPLQSPSHPRQHPASAWKRHGDLNHVVLASRWGTRGTSYGMEYLFGQLGSAVPALSPPNFLCTPSLLAGRAVMSSKGLDSV